MSLQPETLEDQAAFFRDHGYVVVANAVPPDYLTRLRHTVERISPQKGTDRNLLAADPVFADLIDQHAGFPILEALIGDDLQLLAMDLRTCPPGGGNMAWHVDHPFFCPTINTINVALYLDDLTAENGALQIVPRSHKIPFNLKKPDLFADLPGSLKVLCPAGTMVLFSDNLWHRTANNATAHPRRGIFIYYGHFWHKPCAYQESPMPFHSMHWLMGEAHPKRAQLLGLYREGSEFNHYGGE